MKSKEGKEPKEKKKSEPKPRKSSEKGKRVLAQSVPDSGAQPSVAASDRPLEQTNRPSVVASDWPMEHTNGAADGSGATIDQPVAAAISVSVAVTTEEPAAAEAHPPEEMIRVRAYELFMERGCEHGRQLDDWFAAERELKLKYRSA